ncbi:DMT family transporter [Hwanghaeella grinnelliae]|uniref:DMT family transporter n=1 Tax=Hwanghaeella grinnelliae TaxID=2500179 RepID=A0A437QVR4_9PROT|nr:DMT family transporter [Hwanghaeella grinnelliae]RVU38624.1 DMT family transporter [Hwanghaeella grinnelliae]
MSAPLSVNNTRGALLLAIAAAVFTGEVTVVRLLSGEVANGQIVFARAAVQLIIVLGWILATRPSLVKTARPGLHLIRGLTSLLCWFFYYRSFQSLDIAVATTLTFTTSLFVVVLAGPLLKEHVSAGRWALTLLGFAGVMLAMGPENLFAADFNFGFVYGLVAAMAAAALVFQNRVLTRSETTPTIMLYIGLITTLGALPGVIQEWRPLAPELIGMLFLSGGLGTIGMILTVEAYRVGEVSALAPYPYLRIAFAILVGFLMFQELPTVEALIGTAVIVFSALAVRRGEPKRRGLSAPMR